MSCEQEEHIVELMETLVDYEQERLEALEEELQDLLEEVPHACQHVGISNSGRYIMRRPIRFGPRRRLNRECHDATQDYLYFNWIVGFQFSLYLHASNMLDRARKRLEECEHSSKHD